jgi:vacuolar-type H+-ATPase subunit C/Vma6
VTSLDSSVARARGLSTHLLSTRGWDELRGVSDLGSLSERLRSGVDPLPLRTSDPAALERSIRLRSGTRLAVLSGWCRGTPEVLTVLLGDEERRNLRLLVRGVVEGAAPAARVRGTIPTMSLPERALAVLAEQPTLGRMAALLEAWRHPEAKVLAAAAGPGQPDLLHLEVALTRSWAARATAATRSLDAPLRRHLGDVIDLENVLTVLGLAGALGELEPAELLVPGGRSLSMGTLERMARAGSSRDALEMARTANPLAWLERSLAGTTSSTTRERADVALLTMARAEARLLPLSSAPLIVYVLRLRQEMVDLQRLLWGLALGAPPSERRAPE